MKLDAFSYQNQHRYAVVFVIELFVLFNVEFSFYIDFDNCEDERRDDFLDEKLHFEFSEFVFFVFALRS